LQLRGEAELAAMILALNDMGFNAKSAD